MSDVAADRVAARAAAKGPEWKQKMRQRLYDVANECLRCGEQTTDTDRAEVDEGLVHQSCMKPGEEIA